MYRGKTPDILNFMLEAMTFRIHTIPGTYREAEQLLASQERLSSMELLN
jgi:hypothetical protein